MRNFLEKLQILLNESDAKITIDTGNSESILVKFSTGNRPYLEFKNKISAKNIGKLDFKIHNHQYEVPKHKEQTK